MICVRRTELTGRMSQWQWFNAFFCVRWNAKSPALVNTSNAELKTVTWGMCQLSFFINVQIYICACVHDWVFTYMHIINCVLGHDNHAIAFFLGYSLSRQGAQTVCVTPHGLTTPSPGWHCTQHSPLVVYWPDEQSSLLARAPTCQSPERSLKVGPAK